MEAPPQAIETRPGRPSDRPWIESLLREHFGSPRIVSRQAVHEGTSLPALVAERSGTRLGLLLHRIEEGHCQIVALAAARPREGVGRALVARVEALARAERCRRLWLVTTRGNAGARAFLRSLGWRQVAVREGAAREARDLEPATPEGSAGGTPIEDEIEFELDLVPAPEALLEDQHERAWQAWELRILDAASPRTSRALRRVLRVKSWELAAYERRLPGVVRRGARRDLLPLLEPLAELGVRAEVVRRPGPNGS